MWARIHNLLLDQARDLTFDTLEERDICGLPVGFVQRENLFAVRTFRHGPSLASALLKYTMVRASSKTMSALVIRVG